MKTPFPKPAITYEEQVNLLKTRGMTFRDEEEACFFLKHLNYYRLGAYWLPFEADHATHQFNQGTAFEDVLAVYVFDRELRLLVMDAIERVEVSVRSNWAYAMAHLHGPHSHLDKSLAEDENRYDKNLEDLAKEVNRSKEVFIEHMKTNYQEALPPIWAACEVMSLGLLSKWFQNLKPMQTRSEIASVYGLDEAVLASWLHHLTIIRNLCAHHSRLWNRGFRRTPKVPQSKPIMLSREFVSGSRKLYNLLVILLYMMDIIAPNHHWRGRLKSLLTDNRHHLNAMGFPSDWESRSIWSMAR